MFETLKKLSPRRVVVFITQILAGFAIYYFLAHLGLKFATLNKAASPIWPASGFAIAFLVLYGRNLWPAIFAAAFFANFSLGLPWYVAFTIGVGNVLEALVGAWAYQRVKSSRGEWNRYLETLSYLGASALSVNLSALIGTSALALFDVILWQDFPRTFSTWWAGDFVGALLFFPLVLLTPRVNWKKQFWNFTIITSLTGVFSLIYFSNFDLSYLLVLSFAVVFVSVRSMGLWGGLWASLIVMTAGLVSGTLRIGPLSFGNVNANFLGHQLFVLVLLLSSFAFNDFRRVNFNKRFGSTLVFGFFVSAAVYSLFHYQNKIQFDKDMKQIASNIADDFGKRLTRLEMALRSGVAYWKSSKVVEETEWQSFHESQKLDSILPGLRGYGIILKRNGEGDAIFYSRIKEFGLSNFKVHKVTDSISDRSDLILDSVDNYVIVYVEPKERNLPAIGLDVGSERNRRMGALYAAASAKMQITDTVVLLQDQKKRSGFLAFVPIYKAGFDESNVDERVANIEGWAYSPVIYQEFFEGLFDGPNFANVDFAVELVDDGRGEFEIKTAGFDVNTSHLQRAFEEQIQGKTFGFHVKPKANFENPGFNSEKWAFFFCSLFVLILGYFLSNLLELNLRSEERALEMTEDLRKSEMRFKSLSEGSPLGIFQSNEKHQLIYINQKAAEIFGMKMFDLMNGSWLQGIHPDDLALAGNARLRASENKTSYESQYRIIRPSGEVRLIKIFAQRVFLGDGSEGYVGSILDKTDSEKAEEMLNQQRLAVASSSKMASLGEMAGGIAHEINNPLAIVRGRAAVLKLKVTNNKYEPEVFHKDLTLIENTAERISKIIRGLKNFSRNAETDPYDQVPLKQLLEDSLELCRERLKNNNVELKISDIPKAMLHCRSAQLSQVLVNLISNSFDAIVDSKTEDKWIAIDLSTEDGKLSIRVSDCGSGIPEVVVQKMMQPFFTTKGVGKGTGLGLSISVGIMQEHKGRLYYELYNGHTSFVMELPTAIQKNEKEAA